MNYLKVLWEKICGYLIDILFSPSEKILTNDVFQNLPKAQNDDMNIFSIFHYKNATVKKIIKLIKYKGDKKATEQISRIIYDYLLDDIGEKVEINNFVYPIIIPIPATKHRMKEYGFNQCERIVRYIEKISKDGFFEFSYDNLIKIKDSDSQAHTKSRIERLKNIKNSFAIKIPNIVCNRNIILIDDVWTTGATISESRNELLKAGAKKVMAYTIAH